ncbi:MAG: CAP domain-containing protein, partial [Chitinophagaceae bacterium]
ILARILISIITGVLLKATSVEAHRNIANKLLGIIPGFVNGLVNAIIVAALLLALPLFEGLSATTRDSPLANRFVRPAEWLEAKLSPVFDEAIKKTMNKMTVEPGSTESVKLPYTVTKTRTRPDLETQMLAMVNEERRKEGLQPLKADPEMTEVARAHSKDMFAHAHCRCKIFNSW